MRSHTVSAEGGAAGVIGADDSLDEHAFDTIAGGDWMCDQDAVEAFVREAPLELLRMEHWGCPWNREPNGRISVRPFGGMKRKRTWFAADKTGFHMLHTLFQTSLKYTSVTRYDEWFVTKLLVDDGRVQGVVAIDLMSGKIEAITARAVILCTGGCGKVFPFTTNAAIKNGDGMALAYRAGAPLKEQYVSVVCSTPTVLLTALRRRPADGRALRPALPETRADDLLLGHLQLLAGLGSGLLLRDPPGRRRARV